MLAFQVLGLRKKYAAEKPDDFVGLTAYNVFEATLEILHHRVSSTVCFFLSGKIFRITQIVCGFSHGAGDGS